LRIEGVLHLSLNPVLEKILAPFAADSSPLFPSSILKPSAGTKKGKESPPQTETPTPPGRLADSRIFAALLSFLYDYSEEETMKPETEMPPEAASFFAGTQSPAALFRGLRRKIIDDAKKIFPDIDLEMTVRTLLQLELFRAEHCRLLPNGEKIAAYSALSPLERQVYWAAALYLLGQHEAAHNDIGSLYRGRLRKTAVAIHRFVAGVGSEKKVSRSNAQAAVGASGKRGRRVRQCLGSPAFR
jgi:hypothetical protein